MTATIITLSELDGVHCRASTFARRVRREAVIMDLRVQAAMEEAALEMQAPGWAREFREGGA